jgi:hypothetical protein
MVEQAAVNRKVVGSSPTSGATFLNTDSRAGALAEGGLVSNGHRNGHEMVTSI